MKLYASFLVVLMAAICTACESRREYFKVEELYGGYLAKYAGDTDFLEIKPEGIYIHKYQEGGEFREESGTWKFVEVPSDSVKEIDVVFYNFKFRALKGISSARGDWFTLAEKTTENEKSKIHLCFQTEMHLCFIKR